MWAGLPGRGSITVDLYNEHTSSQKICKAEIVEIFVDQIHFCERFGETNMFYFNRKESLDCTGSVLIG